MSLPRNVPVVIVGAGPVGVTLANLLGGYGIETLVLERASEILDYPRAVGVDDEAMRTFQGAGVADALLKDIIQNVPMRMYTAKNQMFAEILPGTREFGWYRRNLFSQPLAERVLRRELGRFPHVRLELGCELTGLAQDANGVTLQVTDRAGEAHTLSTQFLLAADGGRSTVREKLLRLSFEGATHAHKWVVIECDNDPLDAPYTALHCDPVRPYVCLHLPYGIRRWEFMLFPGEDSEQMLQTEKVHELLGRHVADPGKLNVIRARVYTHHSRIADAFVRGRVCLAGDAAHLTPPWIGQGLNAGLRDANNLAWKVAWIVQGRLRPEALQSYHTERAAHAKAMIELADTFGAVLSLTNPWLAKLRDTFFMGIRNISVVRDYVLQMKFKPMPRYLNGIVQDGADVASNERVGRMFIQPQVEIDGSDAMRLDDAIGQGFALISWKKAPELPQAVLAGLARLDCRHFVANLARSGPAVGERFKVPAGASLLEDAENELNRWFAQANVQWVLIRPDRYVAAAGRQSDGAIALGRFIERFVPLAPDATPGHPPLSKPAISPANCELVD